MKLTKHGKFLASCALVAAWTFFILTMSWVSVTVAGSIAVLFFLGGIFGRLLGWKGIIVAAIVMVALALLCPMTLFLMYPVACAGSPSALYGAWTRYKDKIA